jgi:hypothetical protein
VGGVGARSSEANRYAAAGVDKCRPFPCAAKGSDGRGAFGAGFEVRLLFHVSSRDRSLSSSPPDAPCGADAEGVLGGSVAAGVAAAKLRAARVAWRWFTMDRALEP